MDANTLENLEGDDNLDKAICRAVELVSQLKDRAQYGQVEIVIKVQPDKIPSWTASTTELHKCSDN